MVVFFSVGPQSSSHEGLLFVNEFCALDFGNGSERSSLANADDTLTCEAPESDMVAPRFSSILLQIQDKYNSIASNNYIKEKDADVFTIPYDILNEEYVLSELLNIQLLGSTQWEK